MILQVEDAVGPLVEWLHSELPQGLEKSIKLIRFIKPIKFVLSATGQHT